MSATTSFDAGWKDFPWLQFAYGELMTRVARFDSVDGGGHNVHAHDNNGHVMNNPRIGEYFKATSLHTKDENTSWCSAFANWCMQQASIKGTNSAMARSWLTWKGGADLKGKPVPGAVVVFARGKPPSGHVAFVWTINPDGSFYVLGRQPGRPRRQCKTPLCSHVVPCVRSARTRRARRSASCGQMRSRCPAPRRRRSCGSRPIACRPTFARRSKRTRKRPDRAGRCIDPEAAGLASSNSWEGLDDGEGDDNARSDLPPWAVDRMGRSRRI